MIGATDVFVSYKAEDRARLRPLIAALEAEGFTVWWDTHIGGGSHWREDIQEHLDAAKCVIVVWSRRSVGIEGDFVRDEASRARKRRAYLPIRIDPVEPPLGFGEVQAISLKGWKGDRSDPRFLAIAEAVHRRIAGEDIAHVDLGNHGQTMSRRTLVLGSATAATALVATGGWFLLKPSAANAQRIAVLPFDNLSGDATQAYFSEGIAEELRSALTRIGLQVIGRASCEAVKDLDTKIVASKLGVANVLTGSVRRSSAMVRISAQLVDGGDGVQRWEETYDRAPGDEIKIQTDIASNVAQSLSIALGQAGKAALTLGGTTDSAAHDLYLRASALYGNDTSEQAVREGVRLLDAAIARDPLYANAFRMKANFLEYLATSYSENADEMTRGKDAAEQAARRAIAIAPRLGSAYAELAGIEEDRFNFDKAQQFMRQAMALSPGDPKVISTSMYIRWYVCGEPGKALSLADHLAELNPLTPTSYSVRSAILIDLRRYDEAIQAARKSLELAPSREWPHQLIANALILMSRPNEAQTELKSVPADDLYRLASEGIMAARSGDTSAVERIVSQIHKGSGDAAMYQYAQVYAQSRQLDRAFEALEKGLAVRDPGVTGVRSDPFLDPIRSDPRYAALVKKINFPACN
ncbi:MAG: TIR domain-containing protein [Sphingomonas sp.]